MEPISAALGIASAIPALIVTCKQCIDILQTMRHADEDCQLIAFELVNLQALLGELKDRAVNTGQKLDLQPASDPSTPLGRMQARLDDLKAKLTKRKGYRLRYYFQKQSIEDLLQQLDRDKLFLTLEIQKDHEYDHPKSKSISNIDQSIVESHQHRCARCSPISDLLKWQSRYDSASSCRYGHYNVLPDIHNTD